jgi:alkylation response protein AidB-like acyl-CoA dehydrogenase
MTAPHLDSLRAALVERLPARAATAPTSVLGAGSDDLETGRAYLAAVADLGVAVPTWPQAYGGLGADGAEAAAIGALLADRAVPDLYPFGIGLGILGPTLVACGTPEQCARHLPPIASGQEIWCQLFSEPDAGSDLANLGCRAQRDGEEWLVEGQKVWSSRAAYSQFGFLLARTDPSVPKHRGITAFIVDMAAPGVDVRPLRQMNGDRHFSEVFLDGVRLADTARIGDVGDGWRVALVALGFERGGVGTRHSGGATSGRLAALATATGNGGDPIARQRLTALRAAGQVAGWTAERAAARVRGGSPPGPEGSGGKIRWSQHLKLTGDLAKDLQGATGMLVDEEWHPIFLTGPSMSIRGGTDEIQRNIVGERALGLPLEPRVDKDIAYEEARHGRTSPERGA